MLAMTKIEFHEFVFVVSQQPYRMDSSI